MESSDKGLIYSTWLKGLRYANDWFEHIDQDIYFREYQQILDAYFKRPDTECNVACLKDSPEVILGYAVFEPGILHWTFVKPAWRNIGLSKDLIPKDVKVITHLTYKGFRLLKGRIFNPFA